MKRLLVFLILLVSPAAYSQCGATGIAADVVALGNGNTNDASCTLQANLYVQGLGTQITAAATIAPTFAISHVTGATAIVTITPPAHFTGGSIILVPDSAFTWTTAGNISVAGTATINVPVMFTYDGTKWNPSYSSSTGATLGANTFTGTQTAPNFTDSALTPGDCVQASTGGLLATIGSACGSGSSGAMTLIQKQTLGTGATSVTFSSISQAYTHLQLIAQFTTGTISDNIAVRFNGDSTTAHYSWALVYNSGVSAGAASQTGSLSTAQCAFGGGTGMVNMLIPNYTAAVPSIQMGGNFSEIVVGTQSLSGTGSCNWTGTDVTSMVLTTLSAGTFSTGSVFSLYGLN